MAVYRPSRRRVAQRGHLHHHPELSPPGHQSAGIPDRCPEPFALHEKPRGQRRPAQSLEAQPSRTAVGAAVTLERSQSWLVSTVSDLTLTLLQAVSGNG